MNGLRFDNLLNRDFLEVIPLEFISSMLVMITIIILVLIVYFKNKKISPLDKPKGIVNIAEMIVEFADKQVNELMGKRFNGFGGYVIALALYIFLGFIIGLIGIPNPIVISDTAVINSSSLFKPLPNPFTNLAFPLSIAFLTIILIQIYSIKFKRAKYLMKFVSPIPVLGAITMWIPMLSLTLRLFGNAFAGYCLITLAYSAMNAASASLALGPILMPIAHAYFDVFDGLIQTIVFLMITMLNIAQEAPEDEEVLKAVSLKKD